MAMASGQRGRARAADEVLPRRLEDRFGTAAASGDRGDLDAEAGGERQRVADVVVAARPAQAGAERVEGGNGPDGADVSGGCLVGHRPRPQWHGTLAR